TNRKPARAFETSRWLAITATRNERSADGGADCVDTGAPRFRSPAVERVVVRPAGALRGISERQPSTRSAAVAGDGPVHVLDDRLARGSDHDHRRDGSHPSDRRL